MVTKITTAGLRKFAYCPRWYKIQYKCGFNPSSPLKSKYPIGDALRGCLVSGSDADFRSRIGGLTSGEVIVEEKATFAEMIARGELLLKSALSWKDNIGEILWHEQLSKYCLNDIEILGYPDILAKKNNIITLYSIRVSYTSYTDKDRDADIIKMVIFKSGLEKILNVKINRLCAVSMIIRNRKNRISPNTKNVITEIQETPIVLERNLENTAIQSLSDMVAIINAGLFPTTGMQNGTCSWCPFGKQLQGQKFCDFPDEILKEFSETSLQRCNIDKWRDEF